MFDKKFDIIIIGGGLVGLSFALALKNSPLNIALIEKKPPEHFDLNHNFYDLRVYAISQANVKFLKKINIWNQLSKNRVQPIYDMRIFGDDQKSELHFSAYEACVPELSFIVENGYLHSVMWQEMLTQSNVTVFQNYDLIDLNLNNSSESIVSLKSLDSVSESEICLKSQLVIGADGANSWVRSQANIKPTLKPYQQYGLVANFTTEQYHHGVAHQYFYEDSILAYLPLVNNNISIVYSCFEDKKSELLALSKNDPRAFENRVTQAGYARLGQLTLNSEVQAFPLRLMTTESMVLPRVALMGDAGHLVHPLAGQGVNLGFGDAESLANILLNYTEHAHRQSRDIGQIKLLNQYQRSRKEPILAMQTVTDMLQKLFNNSNSVLKVIRNIGLNFTDQHSMIKKLLIKKALG